MISRLHKNIGLFCKRALLKSLYFAKENYIFKEPTNHSHPIPLTPPPPTSRSARNVFRVVFNVVASCQYVCVCVCVCLYEATSVLHQLPPPCHDLRVTHLRRVSTLLPSVYVCVCVCVGAATSDLHPPPSPCHHLRVMFWRNSSLQTYYCAVRLRFARGRILCASMFLGEIVGFEFGFEFGCFDGLQCSVL